MPAEPDAPLPPRLDPRGRGLFGRARLGRSRLGRHRQSFSRRSKRVRRVIGAASLSTKITAALVSLVVLLASGLMWHLTTKVADDVARLPQSALPGGSDSGSGSNAGSGGSKPKDIDGTAENILLVGNDSRRGLTKAQLREVGTDADPSLDTDTILLIHIPADGTGATAVSFPRDSYVDIPGFRKNKINAAYADGASSKGYNGSTLTPAMKAAGVSQLIRTVQDLSGLHVDHYVEVSLLGFYTISDALGGVQVCLARRWYDPQYESGIDVPAGTVTLKGKLALAFVRERHTLPNGDLDRIRRQQAFVSALVRKTLAGGTLLNPIKLNRLVGAVAKSLTLDATLDPIQLADQMRHLAAGQVRFLTIPTDGPGRSPRGQDVIKVSPGQVQQFFDKLIGHPVAPAKPTRPVPAVPRQSVVVTVDNGTNTTGLASDTATRLRTLGFRIGGVGNNNGVVAASVIRYRPEQIGAARTLAAVVPGVRMVATEDDVPLSLTLGTEFTGLGGSAPHPPSTPTPSPTPTAEQRTATDTSCVN